MTLRHEVEHQILTLGKRAENAKKLLLHLYQRPMVSIGDVAGLLEVTHQSATALVKQLESPGILVETTGYGRFGWWRAFFDAEFGVGHRGNTVPERSGVALSFCGRP